MSPQDAFILLASMLAGAVLVFAGLMLLFSDKRSVEGGGVILIGPVPIVLRGRGLRIIALLAAISFAVVLLFLLIAGVIGGAVL
ncbi:MAG: DUF131 domain-containing protein [Nitrososphaerota archaeon]